MTIRVPMVALAATVCVVTSAGAQEMTASATLKPTAGNTTAGTVTFTQKGDKVLVVAKISGLSPGSHGFHIHEKGDCSAPDGMSAGGHFNPTNKPHGSPDAPEHHAGDLPMLVADASGNASLSTEASATSLGGAASDIVGKAVVVHKDADDFKSQPAGNSGPRIACGVIAKS